MTAAKRLALLPLLLAVCLLSIPCSATITMTDTGQRFRSQVDPHLGKPLWTGYDYYARLQVLPQSATANTTRTTTTVSDFCAPPAVRNVTVPADGLPVALLVQGGGGCSTQQKIDTALQYIQPLSLLRFLIINDVDHHERPAANEVYYVTPKQRDEGYMEFQKLLLETQVAAATETNDPSAATLSLPPFAPKQDNDGDPPEKVIPLHIIHITNPVYEQMLNLYVLPGTQALQGGPRLTIDSTTSAGYYGLLDHTTALWICIFAICSACACTVLVLVGNSMNQSQHDWEEWNRQQQLQQQQQQRRQRRRLTREQIRSLLPQYRYDGTQLNLVVHYKSHKHQHGGDDDLMHDEHAHLQDALLAPPSSSSSTIPSPLTTLALPLELDCCSVCLDDYEVGDKIRVLPCHHCFHSRCVGRWLAERSATCPLCKTELWPDEEENEEHDDDEERQDGEPARLAVDEDSFWNRLFFGSSRAPAATLERVDATTVGAVSEQEMTALQPRQDDTQNVGRAVRRSWLRRMFPRHGPWSTRSDDDEETANMLAEPLLAANDEETGQGLMVLEEDLVDEETANMLAEPLLAANDEETGQGLMVLEEDLVDEETANMLAEPLLAANDEETGQGLMVLEEDLVERRTASPAMSYQEEPVEATLESQEEAPQHEEAAEDEESPSSVENGESSPLADDVAAEQTHSSPRQLSV